MKKQLLRSKFSVLAAMGMALCIISALFFGCANPLDMPQADASAAAGYGNVTVSLAGSAARTVFPARAFQNYGYSFTKSGGSPQAMTPDGSGKFTLATGDWTVEVKAYAGAVAEENLAATGKAEFTVNDNAETSVTVYLTGITESGSGTFKYRIQYPTTAAVTEITMKKLSDSDGDDTVDLTNFTETSETEGKVITKTVTSVPAGFYMVSIRLSKDSMVAGRNEVVHIYNGLTSEFGTVGSPVVFTEDDFAHPGAPFAPATPTVVPGDQELAVSWIAVEDATAYEVWYHTADDSDDAQKYGANLTGLTTIIIDLINGTPYYVWVKAKNGVGTSGFSRSASGTPLPAPGDPAAPTVTAGDQQLTVSWTAVSGATAYEVYYHTAANSGDAQQSGGNVTGTTADITSLSNGTTYYVWVKAKNSAGTSGFSPSASGTPLPPPAAPAAPTVTAGNQQLAVSWTAVSGATAYEVWYGTANDTGSVQQSGNNITATTATIGGLVNGTTYYVWIKAKNSAGTSGFSPSANEAPFAGANDATLSRFRPAGPNKLYRQHVSPKFAPATVNYTMPVDYWVNSIQLAVTTTQTGATVASSAAVTTAQSGKVFTFSYNLANGDNNISIVVTAPDGTTTKTYTVVINRDPFYGSGTSMDTCYGTEDEIPDWLLGYWSFVYDGNGSIEDVTITDMPVVSPDNLGRLEFGMGFMGLWIAGDIVYSKEFSSRSGILILQLDPTVGATNPIWDDQTDDGTGFYAIYYFNMVGDGDFGSSARIFQSNQIGSVGGVTAYTTLEEAKTEYIIDNWYSFHLTTIDRVGDPQFKRPDDWVWDGVTIDWWSD